MTLGAALKAARERSDLKLDELGKRLGTTRQTVIRWEKDQMVPSADYRAKLVRVKELKLPRDFFDQYLEQKVTPARLTRRVAQLEEAVSRIERHLFGEAEGADQ